MHADGPSPQQVATADEMIELLSVTPRPGVQGAWLGTSPAWFGPVLFGGFPIAQAIMAATREAPEGRRLHSLHAYFLRPVLAEKPTSYQVEDLRVGRSFATRRLQATQGEKTVLDMTCSFTADTDGYVYDLPPSSAMPALADAPFEPGPGPWIVRWMGPTPARPDGTRESTHRVWLKVAAPLSDDQHLHTALVGFATDLTGIGARPLHLTGDTQGIVSIDHAAWFHRPVRADRWLLYDVHSLVNSGGRGLLRGVMRDEDGKVVVSVAQETLLAVL